MSNTFSSAGQERLFRGVISELETSGYPAGTLLRSEWPFRDHLLSYSPRRIAPAVAFAQTPCAYDTACFSVLLSNEKQGADLITDYRAIGAPYALEVRDDHIVQWTVTKNPTGEDARQVIKPSNLKATFRSFRDEWKPRTVLRLKNLSSSAPTQLALIDVGLIPMLERSIRSRLHPLLQNVIAEAKADCRKRGPVTDSSIVRLVFRVLAGKVMHDRDVAGFASFTSAPDYSELLPKVAGYYGSTKPLGINAHTQQLVIDRMWDAFSFENLSVEMLAYIWENTLVTDEVRDEHSIHATPPSIARYIVNRLPLKSIPRNDRRIVEPCCGSGTFLVAALKRLRELLPLSMSPQDRHAYFVRMLRGVDIDQFGLEVARYCLMLADFPNKNGWKLAREDVFAQPTQSPRFYRALKKARVVLCNPPFKDFTVDQRAEYGACVQPPAELLTRIIRNTPAECAVGYVLPAQFVDAPGYRESRQLIADKYADIELVSLPGTVFSHADHETVLLIAHKRGDRKRPVRVLHRRVEDSDRDKFLDTYEVTRDDIALKGRDEIARKMSVTPLRDLWRFLSSRQKLGSVAEIGRGIEWQPPFDEDKYVSLTDKRGFARGLLRLATSNTDYRYGCRFLMFQPPGTHVYLSIREQDKRGNAFDLPWSSPKVIINAVRRSRKRWRIAAFYDNSGLVVSQNFHGIWATAEWSVKSLCAVLNSYVAAAFLSTHCTRKHNPKKILKELPLPALTENQRAKLDSLVDEYVQISETFGLFSNGPKRSRDVLNEIDATIMKGYSLPLLLLHDLEHYFLSKPDRRPVNDPSPKPFVELQRTKNKEAIELLKQWQQDDSDYDESNWPLAEQLINEASPLGESAD